MRNFRKLTALIIAVAMMAAATVPALADTLDADVTACAAIDVVRGSGTGVTQAEVDKLLSREEAALFILRLEGYEAAALAYTGTATYTDASDADPWWQPILAYLKANQDVVGFRGYLDGSFKPLKTITGKEFYKVLFVALGYVEGVDFTWDTLEASVTNLGWTALAGKMAAAITKEEACKAIVEALNTNVVGSTTQTLIKKLVADGVIAEADAIAGGFDVVVPLAIASAAAETTKSVAVTFNQAAEGVATPVLKSGYLTYYTVLTWDATGTIATLTTSFDLPAGIYQVVAGELTADVAIATSVATSIAVTSTSVEALNGSATLTIKLYNQYGQEMSSAIGNYVVTMYSLADSKMIVQNGDTFDLSTIKHGDTVVVNAVHTGTGLILPQQAYIPVLGAANMATFTIGPYVQAGRIFLKDDATDSVTIPYTCQDQYGNAIALKNLSGADAIETLYKEGDTKYLTINISNETVIPRENVTIDADGVLKVNPAAASTAPVTISVIAIQRDGAGNIVDSKVSYVEITVSALAVASKVAISNPVDVAYVSGAAIEIPYVAYDQYGQIMTDHSTIADFTGDLAIQTNLNLIGGTFGWSSGKLTFTPNTSNFAVGSTTGAQTTIVCTKGQITTAALMVYPQCVPKMIASVTPDFSILQTSSPAAVSMTIDAEDIVVLDQFGNPMPAKAASWGSETINVALTQPSEGTVISAGTSFNPATGSVTITSQGIEGTAAVKFTIGDDAASAKSFNITTIAKEKVDSFTIDAIGTMLSSTVTGTTGYSPAGGFAIANYAKTVTITGYENGEKVLLSNSIIDSFVSAPNYFSFNTGDKKLSATAAGTATVNFFDSNNELLGSMSVIASADLPTIDTTTIVLDVVGDNDEVAVGGDVATTVTAKDSYGVAASTGGYLAVSGTYHTMDASVATVNSSGEIHGVAKGTCQIGFIESTTGTIVYDTITVK